MNKYHIQTIQDYLKRSSLPATWEDTTAQFPDATKEDLAAAFLLQKYRSPLGIILLCSMVGEFILLIFICCTYLFSWSWPVQIFIIAFAALLLTIWYVWQNIIVRQEKIIGELWITILSGNLVYDFENKDNFSLFDGKSVYDNISTFIFDQKPTTYGNYQWTTINTEEKTQHTHYRTFTLQEIKKSYESVIILPHNAFSLSKLFSEDDILIPDQEDTRLESTEFNKKFKIITKGNQRAAYDFFNPRLMEQLIKEYNQYPFDGLEVRNNQLLLVYKKFNFTPRPQFFGPILAPEDLEIVYQQLRNKLEQISRITDVIHRADTVIQEK